MVNGGIFMHSLHGPTRLLQFLVFLETALALHCIATGEELAVGNRKQLFVDDYIVAEKTDVRRVLQTAKKESGGKPVRFWTKDAAGRKVPLKAWIYASPYYDEDRKVFRMWNRVFPDGQSMRYGYSESRDGLDFEFVSELKGIVSNG